MLIWQLVIVVVLGLLYGFFLAFANKKFKVQENDLLSAVEAVLPQAQCGACGFAGCHAYAEAVVLNPEVPPNLCVPGKKNIADKIAGLTGKQLAEVNSCVAYVACSGTNDKTEDMFIYDGVPDCAAATLLHGGAKACRYGCLGFGNCVKACPFKAIKMGDGGIPVIDVNLCTGCGGCVKACPRQIIKLVLRKKQVVVACSSPLKGVLKRKVCSAGCIGCGLCARVCPHRAITVENNLARVNNEICNMRCERAVCMEKCPVKAIVIIDSEAEKKETVSIEITTKASDECKIRGL